MAASSAAFECEPLTPVVERLVHGTNLGAALLAGVWTFAHNAPVLGVLFWLFFLPLPPVSIGIMVYLFFNGNRVALERRIFASPEEFVAVERAWIIAGIVAVPFMLLLLVIFIATIAALVSASSAPQ